ncbi:MAG: hypothetical protein ACLRUZ_11795 [Faecalimonas sp.]
MKKWNIREVIPLEEMTKEEILNAIGTRELSAWAEQVSLPE